MTIKLSPLGSEGLLGVKLTEISDSRGSLMRVFDSNELSEDFRLSQASFVSNAQSHIIRGLHFQNGEFAETKIVLCLTGKIFDVAVNLHSSNTGFPDVHEVTLGLDEEYQGLCIPAGWAHGYQTLSQHSSLLYFMDRPFSPSEQRGIRWDSETLNISWPFPPTLISSRDLEFPSWDSCD